MNTYFAIFKEATNLLETDQAEFIERFDSLYIQMKEFIQRFGYTGKVVVNDFILGYALVDYFEDIRRLKLLHDINDVSGIKTVAYVAYWLLQRKAIQVIELDKDLIYINEKFIVSFLLNYLSDSAKGHILDNESVGLEALTKHIFYYLKFRVLNAQSIETLLIGFFAGQIYQEDKEDLSYKLPSDPFI